MEHSQIIKALEKLATGGTTVDRSFEYGYDEEGNSKPLRKKEVIKEFPPDFRAIQFVTQERDIKKMSVEELMEEAEDLIKKIEELGIGNE